MKRIILFAVTFLLLATLAIAASDKISPITGIIFVAAEPTVDNFHYNESVFGHYINGSPLRFITRARLQEILSEHTLMLTGLIGSEEVKRLGQLAAASHFLEYECYFVEGGQYSNFLDCKLRLININTSEIEYMDETANWITPSKKYSKMAHWPTLGDFFAVLNKHKEKP